MRIEDWGGRKIILSHETDKILWICLWLWLGWMGRSRDNYRRVSHHRDSTCRPLPPPPFCPRRLEPLLWRQLLSSPACLGPTSGRWGPWRPPSPSSQEACRRCLWPHCELYDRMIPSNRRRSEGRDSDSGKDRCSNFQAPFQDNEKRIQYSRTPI